MADSVTLPARGDVVPALRPLVRVRGQRLGRRVRRRRARDQRQRRPVRRTSAALLTDVGYTGAITTGSDNPLAGRPAFIGESNGYRASRATLTPRAGDDVRFQWRIATTPASPARLVRGRRAHLLVRPARPRLRRTATATACRTRATPARRSRPRTANGCRPSRARTADRARAVGAVPGTRAGPARRAPGPTLASATVRSRKLAGKGRKAGCAARCAVSARCGA